LVSYADFITLLFASLLFSMLLCGVGFRESGASTTPSRLSAAGYAEFHPVADNNSTDGRVRNRRVDIVVLNPTSSGLIPAPLSSSQATSSSPVSAPKTASSPKQPPGP
jgi:hypothetical protein